MSAAVNYIPPTAPAKVKITAELTVEEATLLRAVLGRAVADFDGLFKALSKCPEVPHMRLPLTVPAFKYADLVAAR